MNVRTYMTRSSGATVTFDDNSVLELVYGNNSNITSEITSQQRLAIEAYLNKSDTNENDRINPRQNSNSKSHFRGSFRKLSALQKVHPTGNVGDFADIDKGAGTDTIRHIWDESNKDWKAQAGNILPASETNFGSVRIASESETILGDSEDKAITPAGLKSKIATDQDIINGTIGKLLGSEVIVNENDMSSNSDNQVPTQSSVRAYVDASISSIPSAIQVPLQLDVGGADSFALPTAEVGGKSWIITNTATNGTMLGGSNPISVKDGDKIIVRSGIVNSSDDGSDFVKHSNTEKVHSVNGKIGAVSINENKLHFTANIVTRNQLKTKAGDSVFIKQIGQFQTTNGKEWTAKSAQNGLLASVSETKTNITPFIPNPEYSRYSIISTNTETVQINPSKNVEGSTIVFELKNLHAKEVDFVFASSYKNISGSNLGTITIPAGMKRYFVFFSDEINCYQASGHETLTDDTISGNGVTKPLGVTFSQDDGQLMSIGKDKKILVKLDTTQAEQNLRLDANEAAIKNEENATAANKKDKIAQDGLISKNAKAIAKLDSRQKIQSRKSANFISDLSVKIATIDAEQGVQSGRIVANEIALNAEIASTNKEQTVQDARISENKKSILSIQETLEMIMEIINSQQ